MITRTVLIVILSIVFSFALLSQVKLAGAVKKAENPLTLPATFFDRTISGKVTYRMLGGFRRPQVPADGVTVKAKEMFSSDTFTTETDSNGNYTLPVDAGRYFVEVVEEEEDDDINFTPPIKYANVVNDDKSNVSFQGLVFPGRSIPQ